MKKFIFEQQWDKQLSKIKKMGRQEKRPQIWDKTGRFQLKKRVSDEN